MRATRRRTFYAWVRQHPQASWGPAGAAARQPRTAVAVKARDRDTALLLSVSRAGAGGKRRGLRVIGTPVAKGELYRWLKLEWPTEEALEAGASFPLGTCHFPRRRVGTRRLDAPLAPPVLKETIFKALPRPTQK